MEQTPRGRRSASECLRRSSTASEPSSTLSKRDFQNGLPSILFAISGSAPCLVEPTSSRHCLRASIAEKVMPSTTVSWSAKLWIRSRNPLACFVQLLPKALGKNHTSTRWPAKSDKLTSRPCGLGKVNGGAAAPTSGNAINTFSLLKSSTAPGTSAEHKYRSLLIISLVLR